MVARVVRLGVGDGGSQVLQHRGQVGLELVLGVPELLDLRKLIVQEDPDETMQVLASGHIYPHRLAGVLDQHGGLGVLENNVVSGIAPVELGLDFGVQVVVGVLGFPVAPRHSQRVLHRAVGFVARRGLQFRDQYQPFPVVAAVGIQTVLERRGECSLRCPSRRTLSAPAAWCGTVQYAGRKA